MKLLSAKNIILSIAPLAMLGATPLYAAPEGSKHVDWFPDGYDAPAAHEVDSNADAVTEVQVAPAQKSASLADPLVSIEQALMFAAEAAIRANSYDFINYKKQFKEAEVYYTPEGFAELMKHVALSLDVLKAKQLIVNSVPKSAPVILQQGVFKDSAEKFYAWRVQVPLFESHTSSSDKVHNTVLVTMTVRRVSTEESPRGLAVSHINFRVVER